MPVPEHVFAAARTGDIAVLREYFASGDRDPNDTVERTGWTLLDGACRGTRDEVAGLDWGGTPRVISCEVVSFLLSQGASVDYQWPGRASSITMNASYWNASSRGPRHTPRTDGAGRGPRKPPCARRILRRCPAGSSSSCFLSGSQSATGGCTNATRPGSVVASARFIRYTRVTH